MSCKTIGYNIHAKLAELHNTGENTMLELAVKNLDASLEMLEHHIEADNVQAVESTGECALTLHVMK